MKTHLSPLDVIKNLEPGVVIFDDEMKVHFVNGVFLLHFQGVSKNEIFKKDIFMFHKRESFDKIHQMISKINETGRQIVTQFKIISNNNEEKYYLIRLIKLLSENEMKRFYQLLTFDITNFIFNKITKLTKIPVSVGNEIIFVSTEEIVYFEALNIYTKCYTKNGKEYITDFKMAELQNKLDSSKFYRVHRSYVVNIEMIEKIVKNDTRYNIVLIGTNIQIPLSRKRAHEFMKEIGIK
jgi:hypothetical protein